MIKSYITNRINNNKYREYLYVFLLGDTSYFGNTQITKKGFAYGDKQQWDMKITGLKKQRN